MSGHHPFSDLIKDGAPERQAQIEEKVCVLKQDMALHELRQARAESQADLLNASMSAHLQWPKWNGARICR